MYLRPITNTFSHHFVLYTMQLKRSLKFRKLMGLHLSGFHSENGFELVIMSIVLSQNNFL